MLVPSERFELTRAYPRVNVSVVETVNALQLRQALGRVLARLAKTGKPILVEKDRKPAAVLISLQDYRTRFVDVEADRRRAELVERIKQTSFGTPEGRTSLDLLRELRGS